MRHNGSEAAGYAARASARVPAATTDAARERRRAFKRLRLHRQLVPLLVLITLLSTAGIAGLAYIGSRGNAISDARTRMAQDTQMTRTVLTSGGATLQLSDGHLISSASANTPPLTLNDDATVVDHARALVGADITIYQLEGKGLVAISTTLPAAGSRGSPPSARALGDVLPGEVVSAMLGTCGTTAPAACYHPYDGVTSLAGRQYVTDVAPLFDASGVLVGAVGAALPLDAILAPTVQLSIMLLLIGALLALVSLVGGSWVYRVRVERVLDRLDTRLNHLADAASDLEYLAYAQIDHSRRQLHMARQIAEQVRALDAIAQFMEQGQAALRDSTTQMWAEMSQPGAAPDVRLATRLAQQTAVNSARIGSAAEDTHDLCRQLISQMNHIVAEASMVTESGYVMEQRAHELRASVEGVEMTLGERLRRRMVGSSLPLIRQMRAASQRLRRLLPSSATPIAESEASAQRRQVDSSFDTPRGPTNHTVPPRTFGSLRAHHQRPPTPEERAHRAGDGSRRNPTASLPRAPRPPFDAGSSDASDNWHPRRQPPADWLND